MFDNRAYAKHSCRKHQAGSLDPFNNNKEKKPVMKAELGTPG